MPARTVLLGLVAALAMTASSTVVGSSGAAADLGTEHSTTAAVAAPATVAQATEPTLPEAAPVRPTTHVVDLAAAAPEERPSEGPDRVVVSARGAWDLAVVGVTWAPDSPQGGVRARLRTHGGDGWTDWSAVEISADGERVAAPDTRGGTEPVAVLAADAVEVELTAAGGALPRDAELHVVDPGSSPADDDAPLLGPALASGGGRTAPGRSVAAVTTTGPPTVLSRADWGADESLRTWRPAVGEVTGVVVHHTAGTNGYSAEQVPAVIRGIYAYHARSRGWGDIGYNVMVDRFGRVWEGRYGGLTNAVVGAHATGTNATTFGISVLGNYDEVPVPDVAFRRVAQVIAWKFALHGITPEGSATGPNGAALPGRIVGHRDVALTACPGRYFYPRMGELRTLVGDRYRTMPRYPQPPWDVVRLAGKDRYGTSVASSRWVHTSGSTVYVATGRGFADALAAVPAAARTLDPILLVKPGAAPEETLVELQRLRPSKIVVLGGSEAVEPRVVDQLRAYAATVTRVSGSDRYRTAAEVSGRVWPAGAKTVYLASGSTAADALGAGTAAARERAPLLLARPDGLPSVTADELARLAPSRVIVVGGPAAISPSVEQDVRRAVPSAAVTRVGGADRYHTSALLTGRLWSSAPTIYHATGADWPDALSASPSAALDGAPLLLVRPTCTPRVVADLMGALRPELSLVVGGRSVIADGAVHAPC